MKTWRRPDPTSSGRRRGPAVEKSVDIALYSDSGKRLPERMNHPGIIEGSYVRDILAQPDALRRLGADLESSAPWRDLGAEIAGGRWKRVVLTGMGSSCHALYPLHRALADQGIPSLWIETAELLLGYRGWKTPETLLIAVSQSGESAETVNLLRRSSDFGQVIGVTNRAESTLGRAAGTRRILLQAGEESTVSCKTYLNTLGALHWLQSQLLGRDGRQALNEIRAAAAAVESYLAGWQSKVEELALLVEGVESVFITGRGNAIATAGTGGLIFKESTRHHGEGMSSASFRHGPYEMTNDRVLVLIVEGEGPTAELHRRLIGDVVQAGGRAALVGPRTSGARAFTTPAVAAGLEPLAEILAVQLLTLAFAARDGREAGVFQRASKVTVIA